MTLVTTYELRTRLVVREPEGETFESVVRRAAELDIDKAVTIQGRGIGEADVEELSLDLVSVERVDDEAGPGARPPDGVAA